MFEAPFYFTYRHGLIACKSAHVDLVFHPVFCSRANRGARFFPQDNYEIVSFVRCDALLDTCAVVVSD